MSKIGEKPIILSNTVSLTIDNNKIIVKGPQGELSFDVPKELTLVRKENNLIVERKNNEKKVRSIHGLYRQLIGNAVIGVEKPWEKKLEIVGTGYTVKLQGEDLVFKVGYSHLVTFKKQPGMKYQVEGNNKVTVSGYDKQMVGQTAYQIKMIKKPDVYKGKGIRYLGEKLRRKRRISSNIHGTSDKPRISIFRSCRYIYAQAIDDAERKTLLSFSNTDLKKDTNFKKGKKREDSKKIGIGLAKKLIDMKILAGVFDRGSYAYNGRVKAIAEGLREGGLKI